ncbi:MAG: hypothetical protein M1821_004120 [Bathelium mastoideum]|nr:MAG: hypothetical protein M1821_004120 [Bathelium mastoideum]
MAVVPTDNAANVERQRVLLEDNIAKLTRSLRQWQTWEAEYEGLKEEILAFDGEPDGETLKRIGREFGGSLINEKEITDLIGPQKGLQRDSMQIVGLISRRQDYVQQNTRTLQKQVEDLEEQLQALVFASEVEAPGIQQEATLPLTEITEQLDDEGNVISATTSNTGQAEPQILELLQKVGIKDMEQNEPLTTLKRDDANARSTQNQGTTDTNQSRNKTRVNSLEVEDAPNSSIKPARKSVSFAEDTKSAGTDDTSQAPPPTFVEEEITALDIAKDLPVGARLVELDDDDNPIGITTVVSKNESPEDAALRCEMIQYNMEQVGAVVAELDLEEGSSEGIYEEDEDDLDDLESNDMSEIDEEDQYGRTTQTVITDDYRKQMLELEKKLNARMIEVVGASPEIGDTALSDNDAIALNSNDDDVSPNPLTRPLEKQSQRKSVTFAESIDTAPRKISDTPQRAKDASSPKPQLISESISERKLSSRQAAAESSKPTKASRFKTERQNSAHSSAHKGTHEDSAGQTLVQDLVERQSTQSSAVAPELNSLDPALHKKEIARQYHDRRNELIQRQGGFMPFAEDIENPLMEEKDGKIRKVSRFRAARLGTSAV